MHIPTDIFQIIAEYIGAKAGIDQLRLVCSDAALINLPDRLVRYVDDITWPKEGYYSWVTRVICNSAVFYATNITYLDIRRITLPISVDVINSMPNIETLMTTCPLIDDNGIISLPRLDTLIYCGCYDITDVLIVHPTIRRLALNTPIRKKRGAIDILPNLDVLYTTALCDVYPRSLRVLASLCRIHPRNRDVCPNLDVFIGGPNMVTDIIERFPSVTTVITLSAHIYYPIHAFKNLKRLAVAFPIPCETIPYLAGLDYYAYDKDSGFLRQGLTMKNKVSWVDPKNHLSVESVFER